MKEVLKEKLRRSLWLEIDLDQLESNYLALKEMVGSVKVMTAVKANGYGHGIVQCSQVLAECGADYLGVGSADEAILLRENGVRTPILVFESSFIPDMAGVFKEYDLMPTVFNMEQAQALSAVTDKEMKIFVKIDTGRGRLGINAEEFPDFYKKLKEQRYFISLRQYLISKWLEEKGVDWDPFEEKKSDEKLREDYNIEAEVVLDDAIKPLRERLYRILDILLGKVISLQEGILKVRDILSINKEIQLTRAVKDFFDLLLFESEETTSEEIVDEEILSDYDIIGNIRCGRTNRLDERVIDQVKTGMRSLLQIPGTQLTGDIIEERLGILFGTKKEEAIRVYSNISFCITQTEGFLTEREKVVYFSLVKRILDDAESAIRQLDDEMKKLLKNEESKQIDNVGNKIEIEYARIKAEMKSF